VDSGRDGAQRPPTHERAKRPFCRLRSRPVPSGGHRTCPWFTQDGVSDRVSMCQRVASFLL